MHSKALASKTSRCIAFSPAQIVKARNLRLLHKRPIMHA